MPVSIDVVNSGSVEGRRPADDPVHLVALLQQQLREVGAVLPGDAGDEGPLGGRRGGCSFH